MNDFEKLYSVEDIAQMVGMTSRTIRNYLKDSKLKGVKVGGQWRFTQADIDALFNSETAVKETKVKTDDDVADFLSGNTCKSTSAELCTVIDLVCEKSYAADLAERINTEIEDMYGDFDGGIKATYTYDEEKKKARYMLRGGLDFVASLVKMIRKQIKKG